MKTPRPAAARGPLRARLPALVWLYAPTAVVLGATVLAGSSPAMAPRGLLPLSAELLGWVLIGTLAAFHRPLAVAGEPAVRRTGGSALGLGTLVLAPVIGRLGAVPAVWTACLVFLCAEAGRAVVERWAAERRASGAARDASPPAPTAGGAWVRLAAPAGATLAAAAIHSALPADGAFAVASRATWPILAYLTSFAALHLLVLELERRSGRGVGGPGPLKRWAPLALDAGGWLVGLVLVSAVRAPSGGPPEAFGDWGVALLALAFALLAAEAARLGVLRRLAEGRAARLERVQESHARILGEASDPRDIAQQILSECRRVLPVEWFQLELADPAGGQASQSWAAGPDGALSEGSPRPPERPRTLPGIHRRASWRLFERDLEAEGDVLAVVRLWCDPRRIQADAEELFASLVPQMSSSVHRAQLEREARLDPLTQVPVRRNLEHRLAKAHQLVRDDGGTMAVIMCDLDHFKNINDTFGHAAGDQALIAVARALEEHRRESDFCCRYGGEEFAILLEGVNGEAALQLAERLRAAVEAIELVHDGRTIPLALSAGVAAFPEIYVHTPAELLQLADEALYQAKEQGRNRCLLNAGHGRFRTVSGATIRSAGAAELKVPRIFG